MDRILQYSNSDSDEGTETPDHIKESQPNYFGLNSEDDLETKDEDSCLDLFPTSKKQRKIGKDFTVNISGQSLSLPSVDFWKGISEDEISKPQQFAHDFVTPEVKTTPTDEQTCQPPSTSISTSVGGRTEHKYGNDGDKYGLTFATPPLQIIKPYAKATRNVTNNNIENSKLPEEDVLEKPDSGTKRKIYFVHSKVSSHLCRNQKCQPMQKRESLIAAHSGVINRIQWSVAQFSHLLLSASMDTQVKVWNVWSSLEPCVQVLRHHSKAVRDAEWSMCGRNILTCGYDRKAVIADVESGTVLHTFAHTDMVSCARYHSVNPHLLVTSRPNMLCSWDTRTPHEPIREYSYKDKLGTIQDLLFSRDGEKIFCCCDIVSRDSADRTIMAWDFQTGVILSNQIYHEKYTCSRLRHHPTENHFLAQSQGGYIAIFSSSLPFKMDKSKRFEKHKLLGYRIGFDISTDGSLLTTGSADGMMYTYNYHNGKMVRSVKADMDVILDVACHPVLASTYASSGWDGQIQIWR